MAHGLGKVEGGVNAGLYRKHLEKIKKLRVDLYLIRASECSHYEAERIRDAQKRS